MYPNGERVAFKTGNYDGINLLPILPTAIGEARHLGDAR